MFKTSKILDVGWNKLKVVENVLPLGKVARSFSFAKKLLKIPKVAQKLPSTICLGLTDSPRFIIMNYWSVLEQM